MVELPSRRIIFTIIKFSPDSGFGQVTSKFIAEVHNTFFLIFCQSCGQTTWNYYNLKQHNITCKLSLDKPQTNSTRQAISFQVKIVFSAQTAREDTSHVKDLQHTCTAAILGGNISPVLSPCTIHITPIVRVVIPQEFWYT